MSFLSDCGVKENDSDDTIRSKVIFCVIGALLFFVALFCAALIQPYLARLLSINEHFANRSNLIARTSHSTIIPRMPPVGPNSDMQEIPMRNGD